MASIGAYILCGGASSRMGQCKTQVLLSGQPLVQYILDTVSGLNFPTHMVCKAHQHSHLENFGYPLVTDLHTSYHPLEGVVTAFSHAQKKFTHILIVPCDTPLLSVTSIELLTAQTPSVALDSDGNLHPLILHLPIQWHSRSISFRHNNASMREFAADAHRVTVPVQEMMNLNRPTDLHLLMPR